MAQLLASEQMRQNIAELETKFTAGLCGNQWLLAFWPMATVGIFIASYKQTLLSV